MKNNVIIGLALCAAMSCVSLTALAAEDTPIPISAKETSEEVIVGTPEIKVNGEKVDLSKSGLSQYLYDVKDNVMVPLRAVAEKMGYKVEWDGKKQAITIGDNGWEAVINIGEDSYFGVTKIKDAVGMSAPQSYGAAPQIIEDTTFVPAKMFEIMGYTYSSVGQFVDFSNDTAQMPNPFTKHETVEDAKKALSFNAVLPTVIPDGYKLDYVSTMSDNFLQIVYKNGDKKIMYRIAKGSEDISGDYNVYYNVYTDTSKVKIGDFDVTVRKSDKALSVIWTSGDYTFALYADGVNEKEMTDIIASIK